MGRSQVRPPRLESIDLRSRGKGGTWEVPREGGEGPPGGSERVREVIVVATDTKSPQGG